MRTRCRLSARAWLQYYQQPRPPSRLLGRLRQFWDAEHPLGNRIAPILALGGPWSCACGVETASPAPHRVVAMRTGGRLSARLPYNLHRHRRRLLLAKGGHQRQATHPVLAPMAGSRAPGLASPPCGRAPARAIRCLGRSID